MNVRRSVVIVSTAALGMTTGIAAAGDDPPHAGPIPEDVISGGVVDMSRVPEFVETLDSEGGVAGYTRREDIFPPPGPAGTEMDPNDPKPVYAADLTTVVGYMYPGHGFVPDGAAPPTGPPPTSTPLAP